MRLIFMGTPDFAVPTLEALIAADREIAAVYAQPPRPAGRGKKRRPTPVQAAAEAAGLTVRTPVTFKDPADRAAFADLRADAAVVVAYGLLLPQAVLDAPRLGCVNLHASLLPRWRGAAPIQRAIMAGDAETGVCAMRMTLGLDEGPVIATRRTPIADDDTAGTLAARLAALGGPLILEALRGLEDGTAALTEQNATPEAAGGVRYAAKIDKAEAAIDWTEPAALVDGRIRGLSPSPGAWFERAGDRVKVLLSERAPGAPGAAPGEALDDRLTIACGDGEAVRLLRLQRAGKGPVDARAYLNGAPTPAGSRLA